MPDGWFDTHCHVHDERTPGGAAAAIDEARSAGVTEMITVGCDRATSLAALDIAARHDHVYATVGLHPHEARFGVDSIADLFGGDTKAVAVGECGLDYYYDHSPRDVQRDAFAAQIGLAKQLDLPLVIHTRDAWADTFDILDGDGYAGPRGLPLLHRRRRRGTSVPRSWRVPQLLRHRHVQVGDRRAGRGVAVSHRSIARRDRQSVPRAGAEPGQGQPSGMGSAGRYVPREPPWRSDP